MRYNGVMSRGFALFRPLIGVLAVGLGASAAADDFNARGLPAKATYQVTEVSAARPAMSGTELARLRADLQGQGVPNAIITDTIRRNGSVQPGEVKVKRVEVTTYREFMKIEELDRDSGHPLRTQFSNGNLASWHDTTGGGSLFIIDISPAYTTSMVTPHLLLPYYLGLLHPSRLLELDVDFEQIDPNRFRYTSGPNVTDRGNRQVAGETVTYSVVTGQTPTPAVIATQSQWREFGDHRVPGQVVIQLRDGNNAEVRETTFELVDFQVGDSVDTHGLEALAPLGASVMDCQLGPEQCVRYTAGSELLSRSEAEKLLAEKYSLGVERGWVFTPRTLLIVTGVLLVGIGVSVRVASRRTKPHA